MNENAYILALAALARAGSGGGGDGSFPPRGGVALSQLSSAVQASLAKADSALQSSALNAYQTQAIADAGEYFVSTTVEGALQELAAEINGVNSLLGSGVV